MLMLRPSALLFLACARAAFLAPAAGAAPRAAAAGAPLAPAAGAAPRAAAVGAPGAPDPDVFTTNLVGFQCFNVALHPAAQTQQECADLCKADAECKVYSYCPPSSLMCGKMSPSASCGAGTNCNANCSVQNGAEWCQWYSYGKAGIAPSPKQQDCATTLPPTPATIALPPPQANPNATAGMRWGVDFHYNRWSGRDDEIAQVAAAFKIVRIGLIWADVETVKGVYNFSQFDVLATKFAAAGATPMFILAFSNPLYGDPCTTAACADAFGDFGAAAMAHYIGLGLAIVVECQNEPVRRWRGGGMLGGRCKHLPPPSHCHDRTAWASFPPKSSLKCAGQCAPRRRRRRN